MCRWMRRAIFGRTQLTFRPLSFQKCIRSQRQQTPIPELVAAFSRRRSRIIPPPERLAPILIVSQVSQQDGPGIPFEGGTPFGGNPPSRVISEAKSRFGMCLRRAIDCLIRKVCFDPQTVPVFDPPGEGIL